MLLCSCICENWNDIVFGHIGILLVIILKCSHFRIPSFHYFLPLQLKVRFLPYLDEAEQLLSFYQII